MDKPGFIRSEDGTVRLGECKLDAHIMAYSRGSVFLWNFLASPHRVLKQAQGTVEWWFTNSLLGCRLPLAHSLIHHSPTSSTTTTTRCQNQFHRFIHEWTGNWLWQREALLLSTHEYLRSGWWWVDWRMGVVKRRLWWWGIDGNKTNTKAQSPDLVIIWRKQGWL